VIAKQADRDGQAVYGVGIQLLDCWDCGFESGSGDGSLSFVFVFFFCFAGSGLRDELITLSEESKRMCVCLIVCDLGTSIMGRPRLDRACSNTKKKMKAL